MSKDMLKRLSFAVLAFVIGGCATANSEKTAGAISTRAYVMDKERVDQKMEGNYGYIMGKPVAPDRSEYKKTRKIYVVEVTKEAEVIGTPSETSSTSDSSVPKVDTSIPADLMRETPPPAAKQTSSSRQPIVIPSLDDIEETIGSSPKMKSVEAVDEQPESISLVKYKVVKGDTLQKIAKKFYNSYSKWPRILEANEDILKDPNSIKEGMVLRIPVYNEMIPENDDSPNLK